MVTINLKYDFNLHDTITCGQLFRYTVESDNSYTVIIKDRVINIFMDGNKLYIKSNNYDNLEKIVIKYLDLDRDYNYINRRLLMKDDTIKNIINKCKGLKMLNQDPFEMIISYIISANNTVFSIRSSVNMISLKYGKKVLFNNKIYYLFPTPEELNKSSISDLRSTKIGFRDKYVYNIVKSINNKELDMSLINKMSTNDALEYLMKYNGIGPKVASCILLFGYSRFDVFPIDTWVKKMMTELYNVENVKEITKMATEIYGEYCGIAIQYMFHVKRNKDNAKV